MKLYLGIDTSCYTTSLAVIDGEGNLLSEARKVLSVPKGGRGLAQNEAVFQHIGNLPELFGEICHKQDMSQFAGAAAATKPRPEGGSYMPVFRVAESFAQSIANILNIPFARVSHQEGHIAAGLWSAGGPERKEFLAIHLSGGTTEILRVRVGLMDNSPGFSIDILGSSSDLHAGQFVDRVGVALGLPFPAGPQLEVLARGFQTDITIPSSVEGYNISFSGPETAAMRLINQGAAGPDVARAVEKCIVNSLEKVIRRAVIGTGLSSVLLVGGVAANDFLRERLNIKLQGAGAEVYFAEPVYSSDNAVGVALLGKDCLKKVNLTNKS